jgi:hypothetical protein
MLKETRSINARDLIKFALFYFSTYLKAGAVLPYEPSTEELCVYKSLQNFLRQSAIGNLPFFGNYLSVSIWRTLPCGGSPRCGKCPLSICGSLFLCVPYKAIVTETFAECVAEVRGFPQSAKFQKLAPICHVLPHSV